MASFNLGSTQPHERNNLDGPISNKQAGVKTEHFG